MLEAWQWVGDGALEGRAGRGLGEPSWDTASDAGVLIKALPF